MRRIGILSAVFLVLLALAIVPVHAQRVPSEEPETALLPKPPSPFPVSPIYLGDFCWKASKTENTNGPLVPPETFTIRLSLTLRGGRELSRARGRGGGQPADRPGPDHERRWRRGRDGSVADSDHKSRPQPGPVERRRRTSHPPHHHHVGGHVLVGQQYLQHRDPRLQPFLVERHPYPHRLSLSGAPASAGISRRSPLLRASGVLFGARGVRSP
jgi:hypothetical protein